MNEYDEVFSFKEIPGRNEKGILRHIQTTEFVD